MSDLPSTGPQAAPSTVEFFDFFLFDNAGQPAQAFNTFLQWTVTGGSVDLVGGNVPGVLGGPPDQPTGRYVDLGGSTGDPGLFQTLLAYPVVAGRTYNLTFDYRSTGGDFNIATVSIGGLSYTVGTASTEFLQFSVDFVATTTGTVRIAFQGDEADRDNSGVGVDSILFGQALGLPMAFAGTPGVDRYTGGSGADTIIGLAGNDSLSGRAGNDTIRGDAGTDGLFGEAGDDTLDGGADGDFILGGAGDDRLIGGDGVDLLGGDDGGDLLTGGLGGDNLYGGGGIDAIFGEGDADFIAGGDGNDILGGNGGADRLNGGAGADLFVFFQGDGVRGEADVVEDFVSGFDKLDFSAVDANTLVAGDQAFRFIGFSDVPPGAGVMHVGIVQGVGIFLFGYTDNDAQPDVIVNIGTLNVTGADLIL